MKTELELDGRYGRRNASYVGSMESVEAPQTSPPASTSKTGNRAVRYVKSKCTRDLLLSRLPFLQWARTYTWNMLLMDLIAGVTVGFTTIPQSIGYAAVAGLPLQYGLYSAFVGPFLYIFLGTVKEISLGPTAIMALMTYSYARSGGAQYAILLAFLSGCIQVLAAVFRLGVLVEFISAPVISGFVSAAALTVASTQMKGLFGLKFEGSSFVEIWTGVFRHIAEVKPWDAGLGLSAIVVLLLLRKLGSIKSKVTCLSHPFVKRLLWFVSTSRNAIMVIGGCVAAYLLERGGWQPFSLTGDIEPGLPPVQPPPFSVQRTELNDDGSVNATSTVGFGAIASEMGAALALVPLIGILEQIAIAMAFSAGGRTDASQEMLALGVSNVVGSFFGSMAITASFGRSSVASSSGVQTPLANLFSGVMVVCALGFLMPSLSYIPKPILASVIISSVVFMVEYHEVRPMWRSRRIELVPMAVTFVACLFNVEFGLLIGTALHLFLLAYLSNNTRPDVIPEEDGGVVVSADMNLHYPGVEKFRRALVRASAQPPPLTVDLGRVDAVDFSALKMLTSAAADLKTRGSTMRVRAASDTVRAAIAAVLPADHVVFVEST